MKQGMKRRAFLQMAAAGSAVSLGCSRMLAFGGSPRTTAQASPLISAGCRRSKVKVARLHLGTTHGRWPKPNLDFLKEIRFYEGEFSKLKEELSDVEFTVDTLLTSPEQIAPLKDRLKAVEGILAIHFNIGISSILNEILRLCQPTMVFAVPYSGHEWVGFGALRNQPLGAKMDCLLTSDYRQLAAAIRPFRAIHHLREAKILNLTTSDFAEYASDIKNKFGTEIKPVDLKRMVETYNAVNDRDAEDEAERWIKGAERIVEPSRENIFKSVKLALAFEKLLDEEDATVMTVDCYGSMWDKTIKLPDAGIGGQTGLRQRSDRR